MNKVLKRIVWPIMAIPLIYLAIVWNKLPDKIATHFNYKGEADQFSDKKGFILLIGFLAVLGISIYLLLANVYKIDPKKRAAENKGLLHNIGFAVAVFMAALSCIIIHTAVAGETKLNIKYLFAPIGLLWALIGNYMHNIKPNYFAGFRLPWTLENEENWKLTHRLASKLWFAGGLAIAFISIFASMMASLISLFAIGAVMTVIPIIYSYRIYKKQKSATHTN